MITQPSIHRPRQAGFTLVEILAVMAVASVLIGMTAHFMGSANTGGNPRDASLFASSVTMNVRSQAMAAQQPARLLIDAEFDAANPENYLRRLGTVVWSTEGSTPGWVMRETPTKTPDTTFLSESYSSGLHDTMRFDFADFTAQDGTEGRRVLYIEFDAAGRLVPPTTHEARIVFVSGVLDPQTGALTVPDARLPKRDGFIVRKAGRLTFFQEPDQITLATAP